MQQITSGASGPSPVDKHTRRGGKILGWATAGFALVVLLVFVLGGNNPSSDADTQPTRPVAAFAVTEISGLTVTVDGSNSSSAGGHSLTRTEWDWDYDPQNSAAFEAQSTKSLAPDPHTYEQSGKHIIGLRVVQDNGLVSEIAWQEVTVTAVAPVAVTSAVAPACATTWQMGTDAADGNVTEEVPEILGAQSNGDASAAMVVWMDKVKPHAGTLVGAAGFFLHRQVDPATLVDAQGCATLAAVALDQELRLTIAAGNPRPEDAPENGTNSGLVGGLIMASTGPGIDGNRKAVAVTLPDGSVVWVMGRCGNPVVLGTAFVATSPLAPAPVPPPAPVSETPTPGTTPPGTTTPPQKCEWPTPYGEYPICKDSPDNNVLRNTEVPAGVKGNGSNPPGQTAGAASPVTDSPTGCRGSCDNPATASAPAANPAMTQSVISDPPQVQAPVAAVTSIPADAGATGVAGSGCEMDSYGNPIGSNC